MTIRNLAEFIFVYSEEEAKKIYKFINEKVMIAFDAARKKIKDACHT